MPQNHPGAMGSGSNSLTELAAENARLHAELAQLREQSADRAHQLDLYAADLRETFMQERERSRQLSGSYMATVRALSNAVEARDAYTGKHAERVAAYAIEIGRALGLPGPGGTVSPEVEFGFLLHDIGKVAMPDAILFKPGPLTPQERALMDRHPVIGAEILASIEFLGEAAHVVRSHHERWDGSGYPDGLAGAEIPLAARVFAIADVLDALTTDRPYRPRMGLAEARGLIAEASGTHFDPAIADAFASLDDAVLLRIGREIS
jgi:HD-GYP domain-containing protein (c-di-GMP phosphodiesterase class II)